MPEKKRSDQVPDGTYQFSRTAHVTSGVRNLNMSSLLEFGFAGSMSFVTQTSDQGVFHKRELLKVKLGNLTSAT